MGAKLTIQITNGPMLGTKYSIEENFDLIIGRGSDCNIIIPREADPKVSRHHCKLHISLPNVYLKDLNSTNGTFLDGKRVTEDMDITSGSVLHVGETNMKVQIIQPTTCLNCSVVIPDNKMNSCHRAGNVFLCDKCYDQLDAETQLNVKPELRTVNCSVCGKQYQEYVIPGVNKKFVCRNCMPGTPLILKSRKIAGKHMASIEQFEIIDKIGQGGMGSVFHIRDLETGQELAMKVMLPDLAANDILREDFIREMEHTRILYHPNIVRLIHTNDEASDELFFTMEYCEEGSIYDLISKRMNYLSIAEAFDIIEPCLDALEYAHEIEIHNIELNDGRVASAKGLVHRDIKPSNIFLTKKDGKLIPKIADFGLAKAYDLAALTGNTMVGAIAGSLGYIPRQQVKDFKFSLPEVDVWAIAATFYYMLTKRTPRDFRKDIDEVTTVLKTHAVPIRERRPDIPAAVANVIDLALVDSHDLYYKNATEFLLDLKTAISKIDKAEILKSDYNCMRKQAHNNTVKISRTKLT